MQISSQITMLAQAAQLTSSGASVSIGPLQPLRDLLYSILPVEVLALLPIITLIVFAILSIALGKKVNGVALGAVGMAFTAILFLIVDFSGPVFGSMLLFDDFSKFFSYVVLIAGLFVLAVSNLFIGDRTEYNSLLLISLAGALLVVASTDLLILFAAWELMSIPTYALCAFGLRKESIEGATKYFIFGLTSSLIIAFGIAILYGVTGSTSLQAISIILAGSPSIPPLTVLLIVSLFTVGFGFKIGVVPFHMWIPDTYQAAPGTVTTYLAAGTKKAGISAFLKVLILALFLVKLGWIPLIIIISVATMIIGNLLAVTQSDVSRMLAYSSIAQMGYLFVGIAAATGWGIAGAIFFALVHSLMKASAFITVSVVAYYIRRPVTLTDIAGLGKRAPIVAFSFLIAILSLIGLPGTAGFIGKLVVFSSAVDEGLWWLATIGVLNTVLSLGYYMRLIKSIYLEEPNESSLAVKEPKAATAILIISSVIIVALGVFPAPFLDFAYNAASTILPTP
nr:NADH-quinone oxidoreductase subunit N [Candidatus Njordarchaeota archaeon]